MDGMWSRTDWGHASVRSDHIAHDRGLRWTNGEDDARGFGGVDHASVRDNESHARQTPVLARAAETPSKATLAGVTVSAPRFSAGSASSLPADGAPVRA